MIKIFKKALDSELSSLKLAKIDNEKKELQEKYYQERIACANRPLSRNGEKHFKKTERKLASLEKKASRERQKQFQISKGRTR